MRRIFRRQIRKTLAANVPPILQEANFVFDKGEYGRAAELFEQIAQAADARGGPRAPLFHLKAGRARILELFSQHKQFPQLQRAGTRVITELNEKGLKNEAAEIEMWLKSIILLKPLFETDEVAEKRPNLPTHCPSCGAGLRPDEVQWLDDVTAECAYCGSPVR
jgi:hypothetical protein